MQIAYDYQIFSLQQFGGISRYFLELARNLTIQFADMKTTVIAPLFISRLLENEKASGRVEVVGRKLPPFRGKHMILPTVNRLASVQVLRSYQPDILHETYYTDQPVACSCPRILTVYDMIHERFPENFTGVEQRVPALKAAAVTRADHVIAISRATRDDLVSLLGVAPEKVSVIPLASGLRRNHASRGREKRSRPYILFVGLRSGVKNFMTLLQTYLRSDTLRSAHDLVCVGGEQFSPDEMEMIREAGMHGRVIRLEADDTRLASLYANASLFVCPSLYEGFGLPILEAMGCGCPVACSRTGSLPEVAGDAASYFDPLDQEEMQAVLESVISSGGLAESLRRRGYEQEKKFTWVESARQTAKLYRRLAQAGTAGK